MLSPLVISAWLTVFLIILQLALSAATRTVSWNDRFWTLIPPVHALFFAMRPVLFRTPPATIPESIDSRLAVMASVVFVWSTRLTLHAVSRGVYRSGEVDYRYRWLRANVIKHPLIYTLFYIVVVCIYFTVLMTLVVMPMHFAWLARFKKPFNYIDTLALVLTLASISLETVSDNQQQAFHRAKAAAHQKFAEALRNRECSGGGSRALQGCDPSLAADIEDGFLQSGLFSYCRHPNFFAELSMWFSFYLFSIAGPLLYCALFHGSTRLTEYLSAQKYPRYKSYQKRVPRFIPLPFWKPRSHIQSKVETKSR